MLPLLAPILAQLVTLNVGDRTEGRYIAPVDKHYEADTRPLVGLTFGLRHASLTLNYMPYVVAPELDTNPRYTLTFHTLALTGVYQVRRTVVTVNETASYGERDLTADVLGAGRGLTAPTGTAPTLPTSGNASGAAGGSTGGSMTPTGVGTGVQAPSQLHVLPQAIRFEAFTTSVGVTHRPSPAIALATVAGYSLAGGADAAARVDYPLIVGPFFSVSASDRLTHADQVATTVSAQYAGAPGSRTWLTLAGEKYEHAFGPRTAGRVGAGISITRNSQSDGLIGYSVYPTFDLAIGHSLDLAEGILTIGLTAFSSPALDPVRALVDPRLGGGANANWSRERFSLNASATTALSLLSQDSGGAFSSAYGVLAAAYRLGAGFSIECGLRSAWQSFEGQTVLPLTYAAFAAVAYGAQVPLNGGAVRH